jgi:hypothetical protein
MEHRLLVEFYWLLHKTPEYLVQTKCMDCCEGFDYMGERQAGLQELWKIIATTNPTCVQTPQRRMMLQLGELERGGCIRLDQVWNALRSWHKSTSQPISSYWMSLRAPTKNSRNGPRQSRRTCRQSCRTWPSRTRRRAGAELPKGALPPPWRWSSLTLRQRARLWGRASKRRGPERRKGRRRPQGAR